jgi:hypothetical protein
LRRLARTIDIEVGPECFIFRCGQRENRVSTSGYIRKVARQEPPYLFDLERKTDEYSPVHLFGPLAPPLREDFVQVLGAFLIYGAVPLCGRGPVIRPVIVFHGVERLPSADGFAPAVLKEAGKLFALGDREVYFDHVD